MQEENNILKADYGKKSLQSFKDGTLQVGSGLGIVNIDDYMIFKKGNFNLIAGHPNAGKTFARLWYYTMLALKYGFKCDVYSSENEIWVLKMYIMTFYKAKKYNELSPEEFEDGWNWVNHHFNFINPDRLYNVNELLEIFKETDSTICMIDPYNSLITPNGVSKHEYDYQKAGEIRIFCKTTGKTLEILAHGATESQRRVHQKPHEFTGYMTPLNPADIEGGGKWANRCDDLFIYHRYASHPEFWQETHIHVRKVKVNQTGGKQTMSEYPIRLNLHFGSKFNSYEKDVRQFILDEINEGIEIEKEKEKLGNDELPF